jgi:ubiquitin C-terminal hydrolase
MLNKGIDQLAEYAVPSRARAPDSILTIYRGENHFNNAFGGKYVSVLTCPKCKNRSVTPENHITLQLHPSARSNEPICLRKCLASNFSAEEVEASCDKCKYKTGSSRTSQRFCKKVEINRLPNFLIINVSRHMNARVDAYGRFQPQKLMNPVTLNERMVLKEEGDKEVVYKLKAMIAHSGRRMGFGHYIAFTKQPDRAWVICDDTRVSLTPGYPHFLQKGSNR